VDVQASNVFYAVNRESFIEGKAIKEYKAGKGEHYCVE
jgi:hypothetical protein